MPDVVRTVVASGLEVVVQSGAGAYARASDQAYVDAGAQVVPHDPRGEVDVVAHVRAPSAAEVALLRPSTVTIGLLSPGSDPDLVPALAARKVTALSMELVPRISRAQSMDALSSQALVAGYRVALIAADRLPKFFPLFMTAAGTVPPAKVLVLGAGVAGLQAIATARRLGAIVSAYDVRSASADEVRSMGATFVELDLEALEGAGGYAREMTEERAERQRELLAPYVAESDAVITTAAVPGRAAPLLVTRAMVEGMKPGSVVVDLAAETGGNVEGSEPGEVVRIGNAQVWGGRNVPSQMPGPASKLYAQNIVNIVTLMTRAATEDQAPAFAPDFDDEIVAGSCVTHDGEIRHEPTRTALEGEQG